MLKAKFKALCFPLIFWLFFTGSIIGYVLEGIWCIVKKGYWENHSATVWGPFCIIYGIGAVAIYITACFLEKSNSVIQFIAYALLGTTAEYVASLFQELCFGTSSWDYSAYYLNINGRVSFKMTLIWGALGLLFTKCAYIRLKKLSLIMNNKVNTLICVILAIFMLVNVSVTSIAVLRWGDRIDGKPAATGVEKYFDKKYNNEKMKEIFPNMTFVAK